MWLCSYIGIQTHTKNFTYVNAMSLFSRIDGDKDEEPSAKKVSSTNTNVIQSPQLSGTVGKLTVSECPVETAVVVDKENVRTFSAKLEPACDWKP